MTIEQIVEELRDLDQKLLRYAKKFEVNSAEAAYIRAASLVGVLANDIEAQQQAKQDDDVIISMTKKELKDKLSWATEVLGPLYVSVEDLHKAIDKLENGLKEAE